MINWALNNATIYKNFENLKSLQWKQQAPNFIYLKTLWYNILYNLKVLTLFTNLA